MARRVFAALMIAGMLFLAHVQGAGTTQNEGKVGSVDAAGVRASSVGEVDSVSPCGSDTGGPKDVTFTVTVSYSGTGNRSDHFTSTIAVFDTDGNVVVKASKVTGTSSGEQGCIKCPFSAPPTNVKPGSYFVVGTLTDQVFDAQGHPVGPPTFLDAKTCIYNLTK